MQRDLFEEYMPTKKLNRYLLGVRALGSKMVRIRGSWSVKYHNDLESRRCKQ